MLQIVQSPQHALNFLPFHKPIFITLQKVHILTLLSSLCLYLSVWFVYIIEIAYKTSITLISAISEFCGKRTIHSTYLDSSIGTYYFFCHMIGKFLYFPNSNVFNSWILEIFPASPQQMHFLILLLTAQQFPLQQPILLLLLLLPVPPRWQCLHIQKSLILSPLLHFQDPRL